MWLCRVLRNLREVRWKRTLGCSMLFMLAYPPVRKKYSELAEKALKLAEAGNEEEAYKLAQRTDSLATKVGVVGYSVVLILGIVAVILYVMR